MSRKTPLSSETTKLWIIIRKNKEISLSRIKEYCDSEFKRYAFIEHKNHIKVDTGEIEGVHYHIVADAKKNKIALSTRLNTINKWFKFDNSDGIQIEQYDSFEGCLQYLTHKNNKDKTQVDKNEIVHNLSKEDFEILYNAEVGNVITLDLIYTACVTSNNIIDVIRYLGIGNYRLWRQVIWDVWNTMKDKGDFIK